MTKHPSIKGLEKMDDQFSAELDGQDRYYDKDGKPIKFSEWGALFQDRSYQIIEQTEKDDVLVSTVWLGLNHSFGYGPPMIFETMILGGGKWEGDEYQERYSTLEEAVEGHKRACALAFGDSS